LKIKFFAFLALSTCFFAQAAPQHMTQPAGKDDLSDAERYTKRYTGKYLYTDPDPSAGGGIRGRVTGVAMPIVAVFAIPPDEPRFCYKGSVIGSDRREFLFEGLPVAKYDLVVVYGETLYEGLTLHRGDDTLTRVDIEQIEAIIQKSEPFFDTKYIHRLEGETGRMTGLARCIETLLRTSPMIDYAGARYTDHRMSHKLVLLEQVGPGWQISRTREFYACFVKPGTRKPHFIHRRVLSRIRVVDSIKDLGDVNLAMAQR